MLGARALCLSAQILFFLVPAVCGLKEHTCLCKETGDVTPCQYVDRLLKKAPHESNARLNISLCRPAPCGAVKESLVCVEVNGTQTSSGKGPAMYSFLTNSIEFSIPQSGVNTRTTRIILNCGMNQTRSVTIHVQSDSVSLNLTINQVDSCTSLFPNTSTSLLIPLMTTPMAFSASFLPFTTTAPTSTMSSAPIFTLPSPTYSLSVSFSPFFPSSTSPSPIPSSPHPSMHISTLPPPHSLPPSSPPHTLPPSSPPHTLPPSSLPPPHSLPPSSSPHTLPPSSSLPSPHSLPPSSPPHTLPLPSLSSNFPFSLSFSLPSPSSSPPPSPVCPTQPEDCPSCDECMKKLYITVATTIPGTILITALAMLPLIWCCQKAKKRGTYIRMAPTVYFDEDDKD